MKTIQIFLFITILIYLGSANEQPPLCDTEEHLSMVYLRNIHDPTKFWACAELNKPAAQLSCPISTAFDETTRRCVDWLSWRWLEPNFKVKDNRSGSQYTQGHDGRPGCRTDMEMSKVYWRNNNDPTKYWKCGNKGQAASEVSCPHGYAFIAPIEICVTLERWEWSPPVDPPSLA